MKIAESEDQVAFGRWHDLSKNAGLKDVIGILQRNRVAMAGTFIGVLLVLTIITFNLTPLYTGSVSVSIDQRKQQVVKVEEVMSDVQLDSGTMETETAIVRSLGLLGKVVDKLDLTSDAEFAPPPRGLGFSWLLSRIGLAAKPPEETETAEQTKEIARATTIRRLQKRLDVSVVPRSYVIRIEAQSKVPEKAQKIAETIADMYILDQLDAKFDATKRATTWLNGRLSELQQAVSDSERAVSIYRTENNLLDGKTGDVSSQQLSELNSQLILARADLAEKEARLKSVKGLADSGKGVETSSEALQSPLIQHLREQETEVLRKLSELTATYGDRHPRIINAQAELRDLREKIQVEVSKIASALGNDVEVSRVRMKSLEDSLHGVARDVGTDNQAEIKLRELQREADANKTLYELFLTRAKETTQESGSERPDARIISPAMLPQIPSFPNIPFFMAVSLLISLLAAIAVAAILDAMDNGVRTGEQIEEIGGGPTLAMIPSVKSASGISPEDTLIDAPTSPLAEAFRTLRAGLVLSNVDHPPKCIMVTSSLPLEGKTFTAVGLARASAVGGQKVLLIDADLRRPRSHHVFGSKGERGLVHALAGEAHVKDLIYKDAKSELHVLPAGKGIANPGDLFHSNQMKKLIENLTKNYDLIVIDSPPVMAVSDALILTKLVDKLLFVVRWNETPRQVVAEAINKLANVGETSVHTVITQVNLRKHARYGYGDYAYYYGRYKSYYSA